MKRNLLKFLSLAIASLAFAAQAGAVPYVITPGTATVATGPNNSQPSIAQIQTATGVSPLTIAYKKEAGSGSDSGTYASSYSTTFTNTPSDPSDAEIVYGSGAVLSLDPLFLLVKDGNHAPYWYLFNISNWNGTDTIKLTGFWPNGGAISNIVIYAGNSTSVPDGATTLALLGIGLLGLLAARRATGEKA